MKAPESLIPLMEQGLIQEVIRPLRSGKEAQIYLVRVGDDERVAKVYKEANHRSFKHRSQYTEGRTVRNTRDLRAMRKQSNYGKKQDESAWRSTEADIIFRLHAANVTVPQPYDFVENVLIMALVRDAKGEPAPRLADISPAPAEARVIFDQLLAETVRMLCAGVVHGDLSEFNVLMSAEGPVIIDFPQAVDPAKNRNAKKLLLRDIANLERLVTRHTRRRQHARYGQEIWQLFEKQMLSPETRLTGRAKPANDHGGDSILAEMEALDRAARERRAALGLPPPRARTAIIRSAPVAPVETTTDKSVGRRRRRGNRKQPDGAKPSVHPGPASASKPGPRTKPAARNSHTGGTQPSSNAQQSANASETATAKKRPRRRRRRRGPAKASEG